MAIPRTNDKPVIVCGCKCPGAEEPTQAQKDAIKAQLAQQKELSQRQIETQQKMIKRQIETQQKMMKVQSFGLSSIIRFFME